MGLRLKAGFHLFKSLHNELHVHAAVNLNNLTGYIA